MDCEKHIEPFEGMIFPFGIFFNNSKEVLISKHWHEHLEFIRVLQGPVKISINNTDFIADTGNIVFVNSCASHSAISLDKEKASTCSIVFDKFFITNHTEGFDTSFIYSLLLNSTIIESRITKAHPLWVELDSNLKDICYEYENQNICFDMMIKSRIYNTMAVLLRYYKDTILKGRNISKFNYEFDTLKPVLSYIDKNYKNSIKIAEVCKIVNISEFHFCRFFKRVTSMTFIEYINNLKIKFAQKLLLDTNMTIAQISEEAGFHDPSYFNRIFKKINGVNPSNFRQSP